MQRPLVNKQEKHTAAHIKRGKNTQNSKKLEQKKLGKNKTEFLVSYIYISKNLLVSIQTTV